MEPLIADKSRGELSRAISTDKISIAAKAWWPFALTFFCVLLSFTTPAHSEQRIVRVGVYENSPKIFTTTSGKADGIFVDIIKEIARREGWQLRFVHGSWVEGLARLERGEIDLMPDVAYTDERDEIYSFHTEPILASWFQVYAAKHSKIHSLLDLRDMRVAVLEQSVQQEAFQDLVDSYHINITLLPYPSYQDAFEAVSQQKADAVVANHYYGALHHRPFGLTDTAIIFNPSSLFFAAPRDGDPALLAAVDRHVRALKQDPRSVYYQTLKRWTGEEVRYFLPLWLIGLGILVGVILLMSIFWSLALKRKVMLRTRALTQQNRRMVEINQALTDSEQKYRILFETAISAILFIREARIVDCNARALTLFGATREEILGTRLAELSQSTQPDGRSAEDGLRARFTEALEGATPLFEWECRRRDGMPFTAEISLNSLEIDGDGYIVAELRDVSERKHAEADRIARETAEETSRAKSAFVANMSHEIRTPLNAVLGFAQILERDSTLTPRQAEQVRTISRSGEYLLQLINDILDLSRIEAGRTTLNPTAFSLQGLLDDLTMMFTSRAVGKGLLFNIEREDNVPRCITADEGKLRQVLINLIGNAMKFTECGGVVVRMRAEEADDGTEILRLIIEVEDTGPGIAEGDLEQIFHSFQQAEAGMKVGGTGLGLAISRQFIEMMGGEITVRSQLGHGTCFHVVVPVVPAEELITHESGARRRVLGLEPGAGPYRILVVDDIPTNQRVVVDLLRPMGFEVAVANNGVEALDAFSRWKPHAILMDLRMPVMDGYEAITRIRELDPARATAIIALTASAFDDHRDQVMALGTNAYLRKPFRPEELFEVLAACIAIRFRYADAEVVPPAAVDAAHPPVGLTMLPEALVTAMTQAVADGDMMLLGKLITRVAEVDAATAQGLQALADRYDYARIEEWLRQGARYGDNT